MFISSLFIIAKTENKSNHQQEKKRKELWYIIHWNTTQGEENYNMGESKKITFSETN